MFVRNKHRIRSRSAAGQQCCRIHTPKRQAARGVMRCRVPGVLFVCALGVCQVARDIAWLRNVVPQENLGLPTQIHQESLSRAL